MLLGTTSDDRDAAAYDLRKALVAPASLGLVDLPSTALLRLEIGSQRRDSAMKRSTATHHAPAVAVTRGRKRPRPLFTRNGVRVQGTVCKQATGLIHVPPANTAFKNYVFTRPSQAESLTACYRADTLTEWAALACLAAPPPQRTRTGHGAFAQYSGISGDEKAESLPSPHPPKMGHGNPVGKGTPENHNLGRHTRQEGTAGQRRARSGGLQPVGQKLRESLRGNALKRPTVRGNSSMRALCRPWCYT